jgi:penicillin-binding protein 1A
MATQQPNGKSAKPNGAGKPAAKAKSATGKITRNKKRGSMGCMTCLAVMSVIVVAGIVAALWGTAWGVMKVSKMTQDLPNEISLFPLEHTSYMYASDGMFLKELHGDENREYANINELPASLQQAVIAIEDERYYKHNGVDIEGVGRAFRDFFASRTFSGGGASTITMQTAKNIFLSREQTWDRKIKQALLAMDLEKKYSKQEILEYYLNLNYFGEGAYGASKAAEVYYGKDIRKQRLTVAESAMLAAVLKGPGLYSPFRNPDAALRRRNAVVQKMHELGYISTGEYQEAINEPLPRRRHHRGSRFMYYVTFAQAQLTDKKGPFKYSNKEINTEGMRIYVAMDPKLQFFAERTVRGGVVAANLFLAPGRSGADAALLAYARSTDVNLLTVDSMEAYRQFIEDHIAEYCSVCVKKGKAGDGACNKIEASFAPLPGVKKEGKCYALDMYNPGTSEVRSDIVNKVNDIKHARETALSTKRVQQGAIAAVEVQTGRVLALAGGVGFDESKYNRAWQAERQPGSSFKPFVYMTAIKQGYPMESSVSDSRFCIRDWCPRNYGGSYGSGAMVSFHQALVVSKNVPAVRVGQMVGTDEVIALCRDLGITGHMDSTPSLPLGTASISPLQMALAYGAIANGGFRINPVAVDRILTRQGTPLYKYEFKRGKQVLSDNVVARIVPVMQDVMTRGTGTGAQIGYPAAGKTGTTNNFNDAWFVGYTPKIATAAWLGNDDNSLLCTTVTTRGGTRYCGGAHIAGGTIPAPFWRDFMKHAAAELGSAEFELPPKDTEMHRVSVGSGARRETEPSAVEFETDYESLEFNPPGAEIEIQDVPAPTNRPLPRDFFEEPQRKPPRSDQDLFPRNDNNNRPPVADEENLF